MWYYWFVNQKSEVGKLGENIAAEYLRKNRYKIADRNFREKYGELDIVAKSKTGELVFIEVKTMKFNNCQEESGLKPEDNLTGSKLRKLKRIASIYSGNNQNLINDKAGWRIDLIAISLYYNSNGESKVCRLSHYKNI